MGENETIRCVRCNQRKPPQDFRWLPKHHRFCSYCRKCEVEYVREHRKIKNSGQVQNKKTYMKKTFRELCNYMDNAALDNLLYDLRKIKEEVKGDAIN